MTLEKLTIRVEKAGSRMSFGADRQFTVHFNPARLTLNRVANWKGQDAAQRDNPELQFTGAEPGTLNVDLVFDTYDDAAPSTRKRDVRELTKNVYHLTTVEKHGDKHRPPVCQLFWGKAGLVFEGVLQSLDQQLTLFMEDGTPVRATLRCTFKEWRSNAKDLIRQDRQSSDVAKARTLRRGETLASIAAEEMAGPRDWRLIARANGIEDPLAVRPGTRLLIPRVARSS